MLKLEAECAAGDLRITTVTYDELRDIWRNQDLRAELDLLDAQARDEARARGNWDEPTRRERPVVSERLTIKVEPMTMRELVYGGAAVVNRPRAITIIGPMPTRRPAFTSKRPQVVQIVVPESLDNFDEVFW
ncbi:MAG TPA: hypothetical protein VFT22_07070 [Kofleriaceae bacterium]|nr:hypothetical protein [Kofleriaceae bacterium]